MMNLFQDLITLGLVKVKIKSKAVPVLNYLRRLEYLSIA